MQVRKNTRSQQKRQLQFKKTHVSQHTMLVSTSLEGLQAVLFKLNIQSSTPWTNNRASIFSHKQLFFLNEGWGLSRCALFNMAYFYGLPSRLSFSRLPFSYLLVFPSSFSVSIPSFSVISCPAPYFAIAYARNGKGSKEMTRNKQRKGRCRIDWRESLFLLLVNFVEVCLPFAHIFALLLALYGSVEPFGAFWVGQ